MAKTLIVTSGFAVGDTLYRKGRLVAANDPVVTGREHLFRPAEARVERATAAPGELRDVTPPGETASASDSVADTNWSSMTKPELVAELDARGLSTSGTKAELVARLEEVAS